MDPVSEVHEEIGYLKKADIMKDPPKFSTIKPDWEGKILSKRAKAFEILKCFDPLIEDTGQDVVRIEIAGRKVDCWPSSDTWYSLAKGKFGHSIEVLYEKAKPYLNT